VERPRWPTHQKKSANGFSLRPTAMAYSTRSSSWDGRWVPSSRGSTYTSSGRTGYGPSSISTWKHHR
jgi:hypothetical protein